MNSKAVRVDVKKAISYVKQHGGKVEIIRLQHFLGHMNLSEAEKILSEYQLQNGGWYYEDDPTKTVSVGASNIWLRILLELELENTPILKRTATFLIEHQDPDGSWYELKEKLEKSPQAWLNPDIMDNRLWFTISLTVFLMASGFESHPAIKKSSNYLLKWWDEHKQFRVTWWSYWAGIAFFANTRGTRSEAFSVCHSYTKKRLDQYDAFHLGWILDLCKLGNLPASDPLVKAALDRLEHLQGSDGAWSSKYGNAYCTLFALNSLRHYGRIKKKMNLSHSVLAPQLKSMKELYGMQETILSPRRLVRFCGADCSDCETYKRFLIGDKGGLVNPENNYRCCWLPKDYSKGKDCEIRTCCEEKEILFCGECPQFEGCVRMKEFYLKPSYDRLMKRMLEEIKRRHME